MSSHSLPCVLITNAVPREVLAPFEGIARVVLGPSGGDLMSRAEVLRNAPELAAIINQAELRVDHELLAAAPQLRIVANVSMGVNNLDLAAMTAAGVYATNVPSAFVESTADFTLALLLAVVRRLTEADRYVRSGRWRGFQPGVWDGTLLRGKTLGIVGYGAIGHAVEQRALAFGLHVIHYSRRATMTPGYTPLDELVQIADFVSLHTPLNAESRHLFDADRLTRMKSGAILLNVSRGPVVDEVALVEALRSGHLAGAALDVFENEPQVHPALLTMDNVVLAPHIGGGTRESRSEARLLCAENVSRVLTGRPPLTPLNSPLGKPRAGVPAP